LVAEDRHLLSIFRFVVRGTRLGEEQVRIILGLLESSEISFPIAG